jgi:hypothetical protein
MQIQLAVTDMLQGDRQAEMTTLIGRISQPIAKIKMLTGGLLK